MSRSPAAIALLAIGCSALPDAATAWNVSPHEATLGACARANASVFTTTLPDRIVIAFRLDNPSNRACSVSIERVAIETARPATPNRLPPELRLPPSTSAFLAVELPLDSRRAWERNERVLPLVLQARIDGAPPDVASWRLVR